MISPQQWETAGCAQHYQCFRAKLANTTGTGDGIVRLGYSDRQISNPTFADGNTVAFTLKGVYYYLNNHLGTPAAITDSEGAVVWRAEYFPWGDIVDGTVEQVGNHSNRIGLTGHYRDMEMDLDPAGDERDSSILYMRARYYDTEIGRFYSVDPVGPTPGYVYANNNPINYIDPWGRQEDEDDDLKAEEMEPELGERLDPLYRLLNDPKLDYEAAEAYCRANFDIYPFDPLYDIQHNINTEYNQTDPIDNIAKEVEPKLRSITRENTRENLRRWTGKSPTAKEAEANHMLPNKYGDILNPILEPFGLNIHHPMFASWWETASHRQDAFRFNAEWGAFLENNPNPTIDDVFNQARLMGEKYGQEINF